MNFHRRCVKVKIEFNFYILKYFLNLYLIILFSTTAHFDIGKEMRELKRLIKLIKFTIHQ